MKNIGKILIGIFLIGLAGCESDVDFSDIAPNVSEGVEYVVPGNISMKVGKDSLITISGIDSCFVQIVDGEDIINVTTKYVVGDRVFYGGTTSYLIIHPIAAGEAHCRLYNDRWNLDTTLTITIKENVVPGDTDYSVYTFYPENRNFPITQEDVTIGVKGPKTMGTKIMDEFILSSTANGNNNINGNYDSWINIHLNYVGTAYVKFYNEDFDTLIQVNALPSYTTFEEPPLDFDDTHDSVVAKMGTPSVDFITEGILEYMCHGPVYDYTVRVKMLSSGTINEYEVVFVDDEAKTELRLFIEERYKKMGTWDGYYIYARAYDTIFPNIYDGETKVLLENFQQGKVVYKNPENHLNW